MSTDPYEGPHSGHDHDPQVGIETSPAGTDPGPTSGYAGPSGGGQDDLRVPVPDGYGAASPQAAHQSSAADTATQGLKDVKDTTVDKVAESKDVLLDRGADVVAVARDEAADLAREAQAHLKDLWSQAAGQFQEQAAMAQKQAADLLHDLAGELGEMASKSEQHGPMTSLVRQAATRGGALSHWLTNAETKDVLVEVKRFARRRPMAFLAGAAVAGVLVGRLGRGLMAHDDSTQATHSLVSATGPTTHGGPPSTLGAVGGRAAPHMGPDGVTTTDDATPHGLVNTDLFAGEPYDGGLR